MNGQRDDRPATGALLALSVALVVCVLVAAAVGIWLVIR